MPTRIVRQCHPRPAMDAIEKPAWSPRRTSGHGRHGRSPGGVTVSSIIRSNPRWFDRDRFVLSNGHGFMLLYALLHLTGADLPMEELRNFRQWGAKTAGTPSTSLIWH